jgi:hypothetical protein
MTTQIAEIDVPVIVRVQPWADASLNDGRWKCP